MSTVTGIPPKGYQAIPDDSPARRVLRGMLVTAPIFIVLAILLVWITIENPNFTDPLSASSLRIVTFDDAQGEVSRFEVAKDVATGVWSLPSRSSGTR